MRQGQCTDARFDTCGMATAYVKQAYRVPLTLYQTSGCRQLKQRWRRKVCCMADRGVGLSILAGENQAFLEEDGAGGYQRLHSVNSSQALRLSDAFAPLAGGLRKSRAIPGSARVPGSTGGKPR